MTSSAACAGVAPSPAAAAAKLNPKALRSVIILLSFDVQRLPRVRTALSIWTNQSISRQKNLSQGLHDHSESLLSCIQPDICAAQNLQPIEVCDQERRE